MKSITHWAWAAVAVLALAAGYWFGGQVSHGTDTPSELSVEQQAEPEILYWVAPMDPDFRRDGPGKSPMGMDLVPVYAEEDESEDDAFTISPSVQQNLGVRTDAAIVRPLWRRVRATGYLTFDEDRLNRIHMRTAGWVEALNIKAVGDPVRRGQVLFEYYSPEVLNAQKEFQGAQRSGQQRLQAAAREKLRAYGMSAPAIERLEQGAEATRTIEVLSPMSGFITHMDVREGMYLKPETEAMMLADLDSLWMIAEVYEAQADWVVAGQAAEASFSYLPGEVFSGQVDYVYPVLDPSTRTLRVRLKFDNPDGRLRPNMYADVTIFGSARLGALTIPRDALIRASGNDRVVVSLGDGRFQGREVMSGMESGEWVEIIAGLEEGEQVVTSAQFLLDSEASLTGALRRLGQLEEGSAGLQRLVTGSGVIESLDQADRSLLIRHGPIDALGWPGMKMQFEVDEGVSLAAVRTGQNIHFTIQPDANGIYRIVSIHPVESPQEKIPMPEHDHD